MALIIVKLVPKFRLGNLVLEAPASCGLASWSLQYTGSKIGVLESANASLFVDEVEP